MWYHAFMDMLIGHISALEYWRTVGERFLRTGRQRRAATRQARAVMAAKEKPRIGEGNRRPAGCALPLHVLIADACVRTETEGVVTHTWGSPFPDTAFAEAGEGFLMSTPEFCFLQMAGCLSLVQLIQLGFELCGTYALVGGAPAVRRAAPLTTKAKLAAFVEQSSGARGCKKAARAVRYVQDGAASPMETMLAMMLCLPYGLGGYGLEKPLINHRVDVPSSSKRLADRAYCVCDLCWPEAKLCVEYDSARYHVDPDRQDSDARRRSTLIALGYTVVTVTRGQVMDAGAFNRLAHQLAKQTGKRLRYSDPDFTRKHRALRSELLQTFALKEDAR